MHLSHYFMFCNTHAHVPRSRRVVVTYRGFKSLVFNVELCLGFLVDTTFCVKWLAKLIHADILVQVSGFVMVVLLSEWWLFCPCGGWGQPLWAHAWHTSKLSTISWQIITTHITKPTTALYMVIHFSKQILFQYVNNDFVLV